MSSAKPGIFTRLKNALSSTVNEAVEAMSDPGSELELMLDDLAAQIKQAEGDLKQAVVDRKVMEKKIAELEKKEQDWTARAEQALKLGDETLARAALERKNEIAQERLDAQSAMREQLKLVEDMGRDIEESKRRLKSLNLRRGSLVAQARASKQGESSSAAVGISKARKIDEIEEKIDRLEALNEVHAESNKERMEEAAIDAKLRELEGSSEVDDELAALKAKMRQQALPKGED